MSKKQNNKPSFVTLQDILVIAKFFGLTDMWSQGNKYFVQYWTSAKPYSTAPQICYFDTMKSSSQSSFINPCFAMMDDKNQKKTYEELYLEMTNKQ